MKNFDNDETHEYELRELSAKLRGIAFLIESFDENPGPPLDSKTIYWGLGMILSDMSNAILSVARKIGQKELRKVKNKKN